MTTPSMGFSVPGASLRCRLLLLAVAAMVAAAVPAAAQTSPVQPYRTNDHAGIALNVLPPGQGRFLNALEMAQWAADGTVPPENTDQRALYDLLVQAAPKLTPADLPVFFKDASFGVPDDEIVRRYSPRAGVEVLRDRYQVPHVYGTTRSDTLYGAGYVTGEDRLFMVDVLRHLARGRLSEFLGGSPANLQSDRAVRFFADYDENELFAMGERLLSLDPVLGPIARQDLDDFTAGLNQFIAEARVDATRRPGEYDALQIPLLDWKPTDSIALSALIGSQFSLGGGGQVRNSLFLSALEAGHPPVDARAIFDDFRRANDPEAPTSADEAFAFHDAPGPADPEAVARPDATPALAAAMAGLELPDQIDTPAGPIANPLRRGPASNALLVGAAKSTAGKPIAVFGPQVGYYSPQILMEIDLHGPGIDARGAAFPGLSLYVLLGRGRSYAWSATTAYADHIDVRAVRLCNADGSPAGEASTSYLDDGACKPMYRRTDTWLAKPSAGGLPDPDPASLVVTMTTERTRHGIVQARGTVGGEWAAFVLQRSTYMAEVDSTFAFLLASDPDRTRSVADLQQAFSRFNFSFNWHFLDERSIGFTTTGLYPVSAPGVDPDLPYWGDSRWDPVRTLADAEHPQALDPAKGYIVNWNNKQAPLWRASDDNFAFGSIQRVQLLDDGVRAALEGDGRVSVVELVQAMETAATRDVRGAKILRTMLDALGTPADARLAAAAALLGAWERAASHRRDLDLDGQYEHQAAIALMDAWWPRALSSVFGPALGGAFDDVPLGQNSGANPGGSAYWGGWYGQLDKDLRSVLGRPVAGPFSREYCGGGDASACSAALEQSLEEAVVALETAFGADPAGWDVDEEAEKIAFSPVGLVEIEPMQWQNRPTFQQVLVFAGEDGAACPVTRAAGCRAPVEPGRARLTIRSRTDGESSLSWRYTKGAATAKGEFGDPTTNSSFELCVYDAADTLVGRAGVPGDGARWRETSRGYRYVDAAAPGGTSRAVLQAGAAGRTKIVLGAGGPAFVAPRLPIADSVFPLTVQLLGSQGACWEAVYDAARRNTSGSLRAESGSTTTTTTTTSSTSTTVTTTTTMMPSLDGLTALVAPYGDADGDGFANNVELAACSNPADAASTPVNDSSLCANQTIFSDTLGPAWGSTDRQTDPTYDAAVAALVAQNALDCSLYCATTPNIGSQQACLGEWPWSGVPEYGHYTSGRTVEVNFPDEDGNRLAGRLFLPPGVSCSPAVAPPVCDGITDAVACTDDQGRTYPAVAISDGFVGVQRMYYWAAHRLAEHGYITLAFDVSGQGLSQGTFPNGDAGIAGDIPGGGGGFARDIGAALNFLAGSDNPVRDLVRIDPAVIVNQATGGIDHLEPYVLGLAGHSAGATAAIAYQQSTEAAYPVRARAVVAWSHFDAEGTIGNVPIQLYSGDEDSGFIQPPGSGNLGPEMERRYDRLGGDRDLDGTADFTPHDRQIVMTSEGTHLDYSKVPWAYTPTWAEEVEYHYTLAWFDRYLGGDLRRRMGNVAEGVIHSVDRYDDYAGCDAGTDCYSASERLRMSHVRLSDVWCSRYDVGGEADADMKGAGCITE